MAIFNLIRRLENSVWELWAILFTRCMLQGTYTRHFREGITWNPNGYITLETDRPALVITSPSEARYNPGSRIRRSALEPRVISSDYM